MVGLVERWTGDLLEGLAEGLFANSAVGHAVETVDGRLVGDSDDGWWLGIAEGRKEGFMDGQAGSDVGAVEGFLVGPSDGFDGLPVGVSDDGL